MQKRLQRLLILGLLILTSGFFVSGVLANTLFEDESILEMQLHGPLSTVLRDKKRKRPASFTLTSNGSSQEVQVRVRGNSRLRVCKFPPLRFKFNSTDAQDNVFFGLDKVKIVTHCGNAADTQENALKEFLAYKIFNQITDISYRVRLARITYSDSNAKATAIPLVRYAFLIEPRETMTQRLNAKTVKAQGVSLGSLQDSHMAKTYIFQYLIGNTDWSLVKADSDETCCHNGTLLDINKKRFVVPYDFDLSGLVNAPYAYPDKSLRIRRVTQRLYRGFCLAPEQLKSALSEIQSSKPDILELITNLPGVSDNTRLKTENFLKAFFSEANNEKRILEIFKQACL